jgi:hypothetical protein
MNDLKSAAKLALEALQYEADYDTSVTMQKAAIYALEEALAKQEQRNVTKNEHDVLMKALAKSVKVVDAGFLAKQEQGEPVAWILTDKNINSLQVDSIQRLIERLKHAHHTDLCVRINGQDEWFQADWLKHMLKATPQQRTWVGLSDEQFAEACRFAENGNYLVAFQRIQHWIKENNT